MAAPRRRHPAPGARGLFGLYLPPTPLSRLSLLGGVPCVAFARTGNSGSVNIMRSERGQALLLCRHALQLLPDERLLLH